MRAEEVAAFEAHPHHVDAVALRRFDEAGKDAGAHVAPLTTYRSRIEAVLRAG